MFGSAGAHPFAPYIYTDRKRGGIYTNGKRCFSISG